MEKDYGGQNNQEPIEEFLDALEVVYQENIEDYSKLASRYGLSIKEVQCFNGKLVKYMIERQRPDSAYKSFDYRGLDSLRNYYSTCMKYGLIRIAKQQEAVSLDENDKYDHL